MLTKTAFLAALAALAAAVPAPEYSETPETPECEDTTTTTTDTTTTDVNGLTVFPDPYIFTASASRSGTDIQGFNINAEGSKFNLNNVTSTYCPQTLVDCTKVTNATVFAYQALTKTLSLKVNVPGGQQVFVANDGSLSYTVAHSAQMDPPSGAGDFEYTPPVGETSGQLTFRNQSFTACPEGENASGGTVYHIYALALKDPSAGCLAFEFVPSLWALEDVDYAFQYN